MLIEVKETHAPPGPRRSGTVVAKDGAKFDCWPTIMQTIQIGRQYEVETSTNGRGYTVISKATPVNGAAPHQNGAAPYQNGAVQNSNGAHSCSDECFFVTHIVAAMITSGAAPLNGDLDHDKRRLFDTTNLARGLYGATLGLKNGGRTR